MIVSIQKGQSVDSVNEDCHFRKITQIHKEHPWKKKTTYYKSVQNTSLLANTVLVLLTKNTKKRSDRGLVLLGTAINM